MPQPHLRMGFGGGVDVTLQRWVWLAALRVGFGGGEVAAADIAHTPPLRLYPDSVLATRSV